MSIDTFFKALQQFFCINRSKKKKKSKNQSSQKEEIDLDAIGPDGLSLREKEMIFRAMKGYGSWYLCALGHPYFVGDCGRPMETSTCPSCGTSIGGQSHQNVRGVTAGSRFFTAKA